MRRKRFIILCFLTFSMLGMIGCESKLSIEMAPTPTPKPTPKVTPTPLPTPTPTPIPTVTMAPRVIGIKSEGSRCILFTNNLSSSIRQVFMKVSGYADWNQNMIPTESLVRPDETVRMYYVSPEDKGNARFDLKIVTKDGQAYEIYSVDLNDMNSTKLDLDNYGEARLVYLSLATNSEAATDSSWGYYLGHSAMRYRGAYMGEYSSNDYDYD